MIKSLSEGCFAGKVFPFRRRGPVLPSPISPLQCVIHNVLFELGGLWEASTFVCRFLLHLSDSTEAIEVMTWVLHLGNHFHILQKQAVMIAFDKRQSKLHHPPRVLLHTILWRKRKRGGSRLRGGDGRRWVGVMGERKLREGSVGEAPRFRQAPRQQVILGLQVGMWTNVIIDSPLKAVYMVLLWYNITLYIHYKVRDKCPRVQDTHIYLPVHLGGAWIIIRIYWMVVAAPHSIKPFFIGSVINESYSALDRIETTKWVPALDQAELPPCLMKPPPQAVGVEMNGWMSSSSQQRVEKGEWNRERGKARHILQAQEDDTWRDLRVSTHTKLVLVLLHDWPPRCCPTKPPTQWNYFKVPAELYVTRT